MKQGELLMTGFKQLLEKQNAEIEQLQNKNDIWKTKYEKLVYHLTVKK